jgi:hypothetical protein
MPVAVLPSSCSSARNLDTHHLCRLGKAREIDTPEEDFPTTLSHTELMTTAAVKVRLIAVLPVPLAIPAKATASRLPTIREPMVYGSVGVR